MSKRIIEKSFPANLSLTFYDEVAKMEMPTFLSNRDCSSAVYAYLLSQSKGVDSKTMVRKDKLPSITKISKQINISRPTYYKKIEKLKELGYLEDIEYQGIKYYNLKKEVEGPYYFNLPEKTLNALVKSLRKESLKTFIYLGRKFESPNYSNTFTLVELGEHTGYKKKKGRNELQPAAYEDLWYNLYFFQCTGLIDVEQKFDEKKRPYFIIHSITKDLEKIQKVKREWTKQTGEDIAELVEKSIEAGDWSS